MIIGGMHLNQVMLPSTNVELSADFYRRLGFTQIVSALPRYARFECQNGATFSLHAFDTVLPSQTVVYFECDDLDATYVRLRKLGIEFNQAPQDQIRLGERRICRIRRQYHLPVPRRQYPPISALALVRGLAQALSESSNLGHWLG